MTTTKRLTYGAPDGCWGVHGVEMEAQPAKTYAALNKLMEMESIVERLNDPATEDYEAEALMERLRAMAPYEPDPNRVEFSGGMRRRVC